MNKRKLMTHHYVSKSNDIKILKIFIKKKNKGKKYKI